jgi:delta24-sterol reductase
MNLVQFVEVVKKVVVVFLLLPSFIWDTVLYFSLLYKFYIRKESSSHEERVAKIQEQVRRWRVEGRGRKMCTARPSWKSVSPQSIAYKGSMYRIEVDLDHVISIDRVNQYVHVEPSICIGYLNKFLIREGYTLPIVPELDNLTIGGLIMGGGIETTSHKHGLVHHTALEYELVTADGEVIIADAEKNNTDVYFAVPFCYGTLGLLTAAKLKITPYKPYIKMTYRPTYTTEDTMHTLERETMKGVGNDSVEGIMFNLNEAVIMTGEFLEENQVDKTKLNNIGRWYKPWFYKHVRTFLDRGETVEYIPTIHFHQRHNKPCFWLTHLWAPWADHPIARYVLGWAFPFNYQLLKWVKELMLGYNNIGDIFITQDFLIPLTKLKGGIELSSRLVDIWPIWMVPSILHYDDRFGIDQGMKPRSGNIMYVDLGVYGLALNKNFQGHEATLKAFEKWTMDNGGYQALYAETYMTKEEFTEMFTPQLYEKVRDRLPLCKEGFPSTYQKICRNGRNKGIIE